MELSNGKDTSHQESSDVAFLLSYADFLHVEIFEPSSNGFLFANIPISYFLPQRVRVRHCAVYGRTGRLKI